MQPSIGFSDRFRIAASHYLVQPFWRELLSDALQHQRRVDFLTGTTAGHPGRDGWVEPVQMANHEIETCGFFVLVVDVSTFIT